MFRGVPPEQLSWLSKKKKKTLLIQFPKNKSGITERVLMTIVTNTVRIYFIKNIFKSTEIRANHGNMSSNTFFLYTDILFKSSKEQFENIKHNIYPILDKNIFYFCIIAILGS